MHFKVDLYIFINFKINENGVAMAKHFFLFFFITVIAEIKVLTIPNNSSDF